MPQGGRGGTDPSPEGTTVVASASGAAPGMPARHAAGLAWTQRRVPAGDTTAAPSDGDVMVRLSRLLFLLGMVLLPMTRLHLGSALDVSDAVLALAAAVLVVSVRAPQRVPRTPAWHLGAAVVVVGGILASVHADSTSGSLKVVLDGIFVLLVLQWATRTLLDTERRLQSAMGAVVLGTTISALVALEQSFHHHAAAAYSSSERAAGLTQQTNIAGITFAVGLVLAVGLALDRGKGRFWHRPLCVAVIALGLMMTGSVSGMITALAGLCILLVRRGLRLRTLAGALLVIAGVYLVATHVELHFGSTQLNPLARLQATTTQGSGYNTISPREATWSGAWAGIQHQPIIGHGLDADSSVVYYDPYLGVSYPTHDLPLLLWYEGGIFFLVGFALMMGSALRRTLRVGRSPTNDMLLGAAVTVLLFSLQSPELFDRWLWLPFVLAMALRHRDASLRPADRPAAVAAGPEPVAPRPAG